MEKLSNKVIVKWMILPTLIMTAFMLAALFSTMYLENTNPKNISSPNVWYIILSYCGLMALLFAGVMVRYYSYEYEVTNHHLIIVKGIIHKHNLTIPYENIQDVEKEQDILDIVVGTYTVKVETAGMVQAEIEIPGIGREDDLDNRIIMHKNNILKTRGKEDCKEKEVLEAMEKAIVLLSDQMVAIREDFKTLAEIIVSEKIEKEMKEQKEKEAENKDINNTEKTIETEEIGEIEEKYDNDNTEEKKDDEKEDKENIENTEEQKKEEDIKENIKMVRYYDYDELNSEIIQKPKQANTKTETGKRKTAGRRR